MSARSAFLKGYGALDAELAKGGLTHYELISSLVPEAMCALADLIGAVDRLEKSHSTNSPTSGNTCAGGGYDENLLIGLIRAALPENEPRGRAIMILDAIRPYLKD